ncbi:flagellar hook-length control protein FliK, partial [Escherichia coli]
MHQAGWSEAVADRVMWLSSQNLQSAEIQLDPAELGRMEVRIDMNRDQAQITFLSPHAGVRDALEGQMQRLRDMFDQQGLGL